MIEQATRTPGSQDVRQPRTRCGEAPELWIRQWIPRSPSSTFGGARLGLSGHRGSCIDRHRGRLRADRSVARVHADSRLVGLDALRFLAAGLVFAHHLVPAVILPGAGTRPGRRRHGLLRPLGLRRCTGHSWSAALRPGPFSSGELPGSGPPTWSRRSRSPSCFEPAFLADPIGLVTMGATPLGVTWTLKLELRLLPVAVRSSGASCEPSDRQRLAVIVGFARAVLAGDRRGRELHCERRRQPASRCRAFAPGHGRRRAERQPPTLRPSPACSRRSGSSSSPSPS